MQTNLNTFNKNQRWLSELELNLGLGIVISVKDRRVEMHYPAGDCTRLYATGSAPLRRVVFKEGDKIESRDGLQLEVVSTAESDGVLSYLGKDKQGKELRLHEKNLKDTIAFTSPDNRFKSGLFDKSRDFNLRYRALQFQAEMRKSPVRGFIGGRIDLIPHQLYIAHEVSDRQKPRVLLSDETGLGKTIEACLILHRLLLRERIQRALILVPDSLVHQWFVELLRKFNLIFSLIDEAALKQVKKSVVKSKKNKTSLIDDSENIFLENQLYICSMDVFSSNAPLQELARDATWDMVIIDEAHHIVENSPEYLAIKELGQNTDGLLLLTATPEQFGFKSHYSRLHLLDPARYFDYELFQKEEEHYLEVAKAIDKLVTKKPLTKTEEDVLKLPSSQRSLESPQPVMEELLDRLGTGRAVFQNTRSVMKGFPERRANLVALESGGKTSAGLTMKDSQIEWLVSLLESPKKLKVLVICHSKEKAKSVQESLRNFLSMEILLFHEELSLLQRDINASSFADNDGAQVLVCSEIGSEGRNFQFAHNLVLLDLPLNPELLEQRIGRLDRIGQTETIHIHVPYKKGSEGEILARWYHEGLNAFNRNIPGVHLIFEAMQQQLSEVMSQKDFTGLETLIEETKALSKKTSENFKRGKDHLLELNSFRPEIADGLISQIRDADNSSETEKLMLDILDSYGIDEDLISDKTYRLNLSMLATEEFPLPVIQKDDLVITFDRRTAVSHEQMEFITRDHPMVSNALEFLLGSEKGNCSLAVLQGATRQSILLETVFILESIAPKGLFIDRFLPPTPLRVIINHKLEDVERAFSPAYLSKNTKDGSLPEMLDTPQFKQEPFPAMLNKCILMAETTCAGIRNEAAQAMHDALNIEITRLKRLQAINDTIQDKEIELCLQEETLLDKTIYDSRLRLDSLRLVLSKDFQ